MAPASTPAAFPSASAPAAPTAGLVALTPVKPNPTPIRDCRPEEDDTDAYACCNEEGFAAVERMSVNRTVDECRRIAKLPHYAICPTFFARGYHAAVTNCLREAMNRELDRRLLPLKKVDLVEFHREMEIQKHFNKALDATVDAIYPTEPSTGDFHDSFRATVALLDLRARQAASANRGELAISRAPAAPRDALRFKAFADALCAAPALWKATPPTECEARVRGEIQDALTRGGM